MTAGQRVLDFIAAGPPAYPGERWFCDDVHRLGLEDLREEKRRLQLRQLLTDPRERDRWPACWIAARLRRVEEVLHDRR